ncbi:MAG: alanine racemase [Pontimonas sp.]|jgi:alanine racemase
MRRALLASRVLTEHLASFVSQHDIIDLRANAYGFGVEAASRIAADVGFKSALVSPIHQAQCVLPASRERAGCLTQWWEKSSQALMTFQADIISVKRVKANTAVSYGYEYRTSSDTTLVLVSAGFSDGVARTASPGAHMSLGDELFPIAGRIAMDQCVLDVGQAAVAIGDVATIWGQNPTLDQWSLWSNRSSGALLSHLAPRVVRQWT